MPRRFPAIKEKDTAGAMSLSSNMLKKSVRQQDNVI